MKTQPKAQENTAPPRMIGAARFKEQCLALLDRLGPDGLVITKRGKPVARVLPYPSGLGQPDRQSAGQARDPGGYHVHGDSLGRGVLNLDTHILIYALRGRTGR